MLRDRLPDPDHVVFDTPAVTVGEFRCPADHPRFEDSGPARQYCFVFPRNACWIEHEGAPPFVADATVVPLYNRGRPYRRGVIDRGGDCTDWFSASEPIMREMVAAFDPPTAHAADRLFTRGFVPASSATYLAQRRVFNHLEASAAANAPADAMFVEETVISVLADVLERTYGTAASRRERARPMVEAAREHLGRTFRSGESVADVAAAIGVSVFHLCRVFRGETGYGLHRYRTELRLRWSLQALRDRQDILTVALSAGFSHHSHFTAAFRRTFGVRPSEFRC